MATSQPIGAVLDRNVQSRIRIRCALAVTLLALIGSTVSAAGDNDGTAVIAGEVTAIRYTKERGYQGTVKVTRVYTGPESLKGTKFLCATADAGSNNGSTAVPLLKNGEEGIWLLGTDQNTGQRVVVGLYRKEYTPNYSRQIERAEMTGKLSKLSALERLEAADALCGHKTPEVAQLGIDVLFAAKPDDAKRAGLSDFFKELSKNPTATQAALVRADILLEQRDGAKWVGSEQQAALFSRFTDVLTDANAIEVVDHIIRTQYRRSSVGTALSAQKAALLLAKVATDPRQPKDARLAAVARVAEVAKNAGVRPEFTFEVLSAVVRSGADTASRLEAATGLARFKWSAGEREILTALRRTEKDENIAKALDAAIKTDE